ncbi:hypothetical protein BDW75DRAFT_31058 [Aspergillus navahoensis]
MNPPAFLLATATSQPTKPNTRIPPILAAGKASNLNPATSTTTTTAEPPFSRLATLSKQKLFAEAATGDPDLRRCLGHHRLLNRSLDEAKEDMKRYLDEVLESESDDDEEDLFVEYELRKRGVLFQEDEFADDEDDGECLTVEEAEVVAPSTSTSVASAPAPATISRAQLPTPVSSPALATRSVPLCNSTSTTTNPAPVWMKEKIVGAVRGLVRRRNSASLPPPGTSTPVPSPSTTSPPAAAAPKKEPQSTLTHMASSCSQIPVYLHIYDHTSKPARTLERSQSQSQLQSQAQGQGRSITMRGRQYAKRLGLKVTAAVPVAT